VALLTVRCRVCGVLFEATRNDAATCTTRCRVRLHRQNAAKRAEAEDLRRAEEIEAAARLLADLAEVASGRRTKRPA
jgi:hypothetical protein